MNIQTSLFRYAVMAAIIGLLPFLTNAQGDEMQAPTTTPAQHISQLHDGVLLVRLPSNRNKLQAIDKALQNDSLKESSRDKLEALRRLTVEETQQTQSVYTSAFKDYFSFCEVYFFIDHDTRAILEGQKNPMLQDLASEAPDLKRGTSRYILSIGQSPERQLDGLIILDEDLKPIDKPFPRTVLTTGLAALLASFSSEPEEFIYVERLDKRLHKYYAKAGM